MKAILKRAVFLVAVILLCFSCMAPMAYAADSTPSIVGSEAFEGLTGNGKYLGSQYRDNYALDTEELGFMDAIEKAGTYLANVVLDMDTKLSFLGIQLFHAAMQLNVAELAGDELNTMQQALKNSVFEPLFIVGFIGIALALIKKLLYRNLTGIIAELAKVVLIIVFVFLLGTNTADVLSKVCGVTRDLGLSVVMQINGRDAEGDPEAFAAETAGVLWNDLIHQPWLHLEFLNDSGYAREDVDAILGDAPYSDARQETINEYIEGHTGTFAKESSWLRLGTLLLYSVVMIVKLLVYVACSAVMLAFQLLAIFYALLGIVIMILAMFESFGGIHLIADWLKKMLETQVMILITTMLLGVLIWFGNITRFLDGTLGWLAGMLLQTVIIVVVFTFRKQIFHGVQKMSRNPQSIPRQMLAVSPAGAASAIYYERRMERDRKRTIQYQEGAREVQQSQLDYAKDRKDLARSQRELVEKQKETADLRNEKLRQDLERREEARQRKEAREAAAAEKETNRRKAEDPPVSRPRTTAAAPAAKNGAEAKTQESEVQRPVTTPRAAVDRTSGENGAIRYPEHAEGTAAAEDLARNSLDYGRERKEPATPETPAPTLGQAAVETPAHTSGPERPVTTVPKASGVGREDDTAAAAPSAVQRPMAAAKPSEATQWSQNAPQRPSERPEVMRYPNTPEARRMSPGASQGPLRPREDREPPETAVRRPEMPRENAGAPPVSTDTRSGQSVTEASQMAKTTVPAGSKNVSATEKAAVAPPTQRAARTHQDLAAARAERKQAQAGRAASAGSIRYDRQTAPEEARGVDRPDIARTDEAADSPSRAMVEADTENNVKKEEKTT